MKRALEIIYRMLDRVTLRLRARLLALQHMRKPRTLTESAAPWWEDDDDGQA